MRPMREKMHTGELYLPNDDEIFQDQIRKLDRLYDFNMTRPTQLDKRKEMLKEMFAEIVEDCYIEPPLHANMAGAYVHFGKNVYANFNLTLVDDGHIYVGDYTMIGPNVTIATAGHNRCRLSWWIQSHRIPNRRATFGCLLFTPLHRTHPTRRRDIRIRDSRP